MEKVTLPISKTDLAELLHKLERGEADAYDTVVDLFWEALHCPAELTWLQPSPQEV